MGLKENLKNLFEGIRTVVAIIALCSISFGLGFKWRTPAQPEQTHSVEVPRTLPQKVDIATCRISNTAAGFFHDSAIILKQDMGAKKSRVFLAESEELGRYNPFTWTVELWPEFSSYGLHTRSVYLRRIGSPLEFYHSLTWQRQGSRFPVDVPMSESNDRILMLLAISGDQEITADCKRLLKTTVGPPTH